MLQAAGEGIHRRPAPIGRRCDADGDGAVGIGAHRDTPTSRDTGTVTAEASQPRPVRVGLVLGAGGESGGAYLRAALAEIEQLTGWDRRTAHAIVGTSVGALNGARLGFTVAGTTTTVAAEIAALADRLPQLPTSIADSLVASLRRIGGRALAALGPAGKHTATYPLARAPYPPQLRVVSVERRRGRRRVTLLATADDPAAELYASAAVPGWATPVVLDGRNHIDGAVHSPTNADLLSPDGLDLLIVIAPMASRRGGRIVARSHRALLAAELAPWRRSAKPILVVVPTGDEIAGRADHDRFAEAARTFLRG